MRRHTLGDIPQGGWSFETTDGEQPDPKVLSAELQEIETELTKLGTDAGALQGRLDIVADLLGHAEQQLWAEDFVIHLDNMNIRRDSQDASAQRIALQELHNARGAGLVMLLVSLVPGELPRRENFITAAGRYLI